MMIVVREATSQDKECVDEVLALANRTLRAIYRPTKAALANKVRLDRKLNRLVALVEDRVVGTVQYDVIENRLHLIGLAVHPTYQRRGIARRLVRFLYERARRSAVQKLSLYTIKETGNVPIFERLGFHVVSEKPDNLFESDSCDQLTEVYMEKVVA